MNKKSSLILGFWEMGIIGILMVAFFPWSLLFCVLFYGLEYTKCLVLALIHDAVKTVLAILAVILLTSAVAIFVAVIIAESHRILALLGSPPAGLPEGLPEGSRRIGQTRDGLPVYQAPDGQQFVLE